jgi:hypothetical protein
VGANAAIFGVVNAVLLRPLPFPHADRLMMVYATNPRSGNVTDVTSYPEVEDWKAQNHSFDRVAAFTARPATVSNPDVETQAEMIFAVQAAVSALLLLSAFLASYGPARRGSRVDPMIAVRESN